MVPLVFNRNAAYAVLFFLTSAGTVLRLFCLPSVDRQNRSLSLWLKRFLYVLFPWFILKATYAVSDRRLAYFATELLLFILSMLYLAFLSNVTRKHLKVFPHPKTRVSILFCALLVVFIFPSFLRSTIGLYASIKERSEWEGKLYQRDALLGYSLIPGSTGTQKKPYSPEIPVRIDLQGFRVPASLPDDRSGRHPRLLALGCSYTFGYCCLAEETYPYRQAESLHVQSLNAGVCGYGAAPMLLLARRLIPQYNRNM